MACWSLSDRISLHEESIFVFFWSINDNKTFHIGNYFLKHLHLGGHSQLRKRQNPLENKPRIYWQSTIVLYGHFHIKLTYRMFLFTSFLSLSHYFGRAVDSRYQSVLCFDWFPTDPVNPTWYLGVRAVVSIYWFSSPTEITQTVRIIQIILHHLWITVKFGYNQHSSMDLESYYSSESHKSDRIHRKLGGPWSFNSPWTQA